MIMIEIGPFGIELFSFILFVGNIIKVVRLWMEFPHHTVAGISGYRIDIPLVRFIIESSAAQAICQ